MGYACSRNIAHYVEQRFAAGYRSARDVTCKTTFAKQKPQPLANCVQCTLSQEQLVSGFPVNATSTKEDSCCVGWQSTERTNCARPKRTSSMQHIWISTRQLKSVTGGTPNLWPFQQHQGDWARAGQNPVRSPTGFSSRSTKKITQECDTNRSSAHMIIPAIQTGRSPVRIPDEVDFFNVPNSYSRTMALGVDSASNRNEYQESSWR
jgi:hypothetical protein